MANKATGIKARRNKSWKGQDVTYTYSAKQKTSDRSVLNRTKGYDNDLLKEGQENRGRKKSGSPRGTTKTSKKGQK